VPNYFELYGQRIQVPDNARTWTYWINTSNTVTAATTPVYLNTDTFNQWTTSTVNVNSQIWGNWANSTPYRIDATAFGDTNRTYLTRREPIAYTPEQIAAQEAAQAETRRLREEQERRKAAATKKARALLRATLTPAQRRELDRLNRFHVIVEGRTYRINRGVSGNIELLEERGDELFVKESFCIHSDHELPVEDHMLAQKLLLETDEVAFRRIANITRRGHRAAA
jgi:hypothetical protein